MAGGLGAVGGGLVAVKALHGQLVPGFGPGRRPGLPVMPPGGDSAPHIQNDAGCPNEAIERRKAG